MGNVSLSCNILYRKGIFTGVNLKFKHNQSISFLVYKYNIYETCNTNLEFIRAYEVPTEVKR